MEIIPRTILKRVGLKLPANAKDMLRVGSLRIYDIIELLVNTINAVAKANDENIDKEEEFLASLNDALDKWADDQEASIEALKNTVINYITTGEWAADGFIKSAAAFSASFWDTLSKAMITDANILSPGSDGNEYRDGQNWVVRFNTKNETPIYLNIEKLMNNIQIVVDEERGGAVFSDNNKDFEEIGVIPFATASDSGLMRKTDKAKLDGISWDAQNGLFHIGGETFKLTPYRPDAEREYSEPVIMEVSYDEIPNSGGVVRPYVEVSQNVTLHQGGVYRNVIITAAYGYDSQTGQMKTTYTNGQYMKEGGSLELTFNFNNLVQGVTAGTDGTITKQSAATSSESVMMATVTVAARMNDVSAEETGSTDVYQGGTVETSIEYLTPEIVSFEYNRVPSAGGSATPTIVVSQGVRITTGSQVETKTIVATYQWNPSSSQMEATYTNGEYMGQDGALALDFDFDDVEQDVVTGTDGVVSMATASEAESATKLASSTVTATINGVEAESTMLADVYQNTAEQEAVVYYGSSDTLPDSLGENSIELSDGTNEINNSNSEGNFQWAAVPSSLAATVVIADSEGGYVEQATSTTQIDGYVLYYWQSYARTDGARITITI